MSRVPLHVVKIGGSLLDLGDLSHRLQTWLDEQPLAHRLLVVGGGQRADEVRRQYRARQLDDEHAHWACIDMMEANSRQLATRLPGIPVLSTSHEFCERIKRPGATFLESASFMRREEAVLPGTKLPMNWSATSDSIAARAAIAFRADVLVLLKSALPAMNPPGSLQQLADEGYVDSFLPHLSGELRSWEIWNLRDRPTRWGTAGQ